MQLTITSSEGMNAEIHSIGRQLEMPFAEVRLIYLVVAIYPIVPINNRVIPTRWAVEN